MRQYSQDNWFGWGYDHVPFTFRTSASQSLTIDFGRRARRPVKSVFDESIETAKLIYEVHGSPTIQFSGGLDSELVVSAFRHAKLPFKCSIMRFANGHNSYDIENAISYCDAFNIKYDFFDIDVVEFLKGGEAEEIIRESQCKQAAFALFMKAMTSIDGFILHGGGEPVIENQPDMEMELDRKHKRNWVCWEHERYYSGLKFVMKRNLNAVACFYQYTPEMWVSMFKSPHIQRMVRNQFNKSVTKSEDIKIMTNEGHKPAPRIKFTGFERILDDLWDRCNYLNSSSEFYYNDDWTMPYEQILTTLDYQP